MYEVTFIEAGVTVNWTKKQCIDFFGKDEFSECVAGYAPHVVIIKL